MKKNNNRSMAKIFLVQTILAFLIVLFTLFTLKVAFTSLQLFFISDEIHYLEQGNWSAEDTVRYGELIANRISIKNSSWIGFFLVIAGCNFLAKSIRMIILLTLIVTNFFTINFLFSMIKSDYKLICKIIQKRKSKVPGKQH